MYVHTPVFIITAEGPYRCPLPRNPAYRPFSSPPLSPAIGVDVAGSVMPHRDQVCCRGCDFFCSLLVELESTERREYSRLCTFLETILTMVWYPSCVATLSRYTKVRRRRRVSNFFSPLRVVSFAVLRPLPPRSSAPSPRHGSPLASASPSGISEGSVAISFGCILVPWATNRFPARPFSRARYGMTRIRRGVRPAYRAPVRRDGARRDWAAVHHYTPLLLWVAPAIGPVRAGSDRPSAAGAVVSLLVFPCLAVVSNCLWFVLVLV